MRVWEVESGRLVRALAGRAGVVYALAGLPGGLVASGSWDKTVRVWEVESGRLVRTLAGHTGFVMALAVLPGGCWRVRRTTGLLWSGASLTLWVNEHHGPLF